MQLKMSSILDESDIGVLALNRLCSEKSPHGMVTIAYRASIVYIKFIRTHAQYDAIDAATVKME